MVDLDAYFAGVEERTAYAMSVGHADPLVSQDSMPVVIKNASRSDLPELFRKRGYKVGAEIGVLYGDYSEEMCKGLPGVELYCVDRWAPYKSGKTGKTIFHRAVKAYEVAKTRLAPYGYRLIRMDSLAAAKEFADQSLDFVYIDANHWFEHVVADMAAWIPKVRPGGVIAGHDYEEHLEEDNCVKLAVTSWTIAHGVQPWYVLGRAKVRHGEHRDEHRSWMWFKP